MNINTNELNAKIKLSPSAVIKKDEKKYKNQIYKIASFIASQKRYRFILVAGPSSSGKTTTSFILTNKLAERGYMARVISLDDFFLNREDTPLLKDGSKDYESVNSIDWKLFNKCMTKLLKGQGVVLPSYNFMTGNKEFPQDVTTLEENDIIIIEGLHALNPLIDQFIPKELSIKIYLSPQDCYYYDNEMILDNFEIRFIRRALRDEQRRGSNPLLTYQMWNSVISGEIEYIDPYKHLANFVIDTSHSYEAGVYKTYILQALSPYKKEKIKLFSKITSGLQNVSIIDKNLVPNDSLIQEFLGNK